MGYLSYQVVIAGFLNQQRLKPQNVHLWGKGWEPRTFIIFISRGLQQSHRIHVWYIYLYFVDFYGKHVCKYTIVPWIRHGNYNLHLSWGVLGVQLLSHFLKHTRKNPEILMLFEDGQPASLKFWGFQGLGHLFQGG